MNTFFGHLIPYNPGSRIFSEKQSWSKDGGPYCPLHSKLGRSLQPFWSEVQRSKKKTFLETYSPIIQD